MSAIEQEPTIIVGAGWAGLTAALALSRQGKKIIVLEAAPQAGGRARKIFFGEDIVDNGQHLLLGAYHNILTALKWLGIPEQSILHRTPLELWITDPSMPLHPFYIQTLKFSSRLRLLNGLLKLKGLTWQERFKMAQFFHVIQKNRFQFNLEADVSIKELLVSFNQPSTLITKLWAPIAVAALSTPIHEASAQVFLQILKDTFCKDQGNSDLLFPKTDLSELLPNPILKYLAHNNGSIFYTQRVKSLIIEDEQCKGICTETKQFRGKNIILATPPHVSAQLLLQSKVSNYCKPLIENLLKFQYQPITTVYLRYKTPIEFEIPMIGFINSTIHWVFDRRLTGHPNILSVVITGDDVHLSLEHSQLITKITTEINAAFPKFKQTPLEYRIIREKRAAFSCHVGVNHYRPNNTTSIPRLWLAGDYTQTYYPATLEGAVQSGMQVAQLMQQL